MTVQEFGQPGLAGRKIRVVLADDHQELIAMVRMVLSDGFEILKATSDGHQAVNAVLALDPDVLVTDISIPILDGFHIARTILKANCRAKVVFLTIHEGQDFIAAALSAGGSGYVTKRRLSTDLVFAIRESLHGRTFVSNSLRI